MEETDSSKLRPADEDCRKDACKVGQKRLSEARFEPTGVPLLALASGVLNAWFLRIAAGFCLGI